MLVKASKFAQAPEVDMATDCGGGSSGLVQAKSFKSAPKRIRVKIGGVYVTGDKASPAQVKQAVSQSTDMLQRLGHRMSRPGVTLRARRDVPLFSVDPEHPDRFLRKMNGKVERGVLVDGAFTVVD